MDQPSSTVPESLRAELLPIAIAAEARAEEALVKIREFDKVKAFLPDLLTVADEALAMWQGQYTARRDRADAIWERIGNLTPEEAEGMQTERVARWRREVAEADARQPKLDEMAMHPEIWATSPEEIQFDRAFQDGAAKMSPSQLRIDAAQNRARRQAVAEYLASITDSESPVALSE